MHPSSKSCALLDSEDNIHKNPLWWTKNIFKQCLIHVPLILVYNLKVFHLHQLLHCHFPSHWPLPLLPSLWSGASVLPVPIDAVDLPLQPNFGAAFPELWEHADFVWGIIYNIYIYLCVCMCDFEIHVSKYEHVTYKQYVCVIIIMVIDPWKNSICWI